MKRFLLFGVLAVVGVAIFASVSPAEPSNLCFACAFLAIVVILLMIFAKENAQVAFGILTIAVLGSIAFFNWPLHLAYIASRPSFEDFAQRLRDGEQIRVPAQIGMFRVVNAEVNHNNVVCFWTDDDPSGGTGFVNFGPDHLPFNLWSHTHLDDSWQFITED